MVQDFNITKKMADEVMTVHINGDLNIKTSPLFEEDVKKSLDGVKELKLDFKNVEYISSAGLRVILALEKTMRRQNGMMKLLHLSPAIKEIIRLAGFLQVMNIEE